MKLLIVWAVTIIGTIPALPALAVEQHEEYLDWYYARQKILRTSIVFDDARFQPHELPIKPDLQPRLRPISEESFKFELDPTGYRLVWKDGTQMPDTLAEDYREVIKQKQEYEEVYPWAVGLGIAIIVWNLALLIWSLAQAIYRRRLGAEQNISLDRGD